MEFKGRLNHSLEVGRHQDTAGGTGSPGKEQEGTCGLMNMFFISAGVGVTRMHILFNIHQSVYIRSVYVLICKLCFSYCLQTKVKAEARKLC